MLTSGAQNDGGITTSSRDAGQQTGSTWYEDEQEEEGVLEVSRGQPVSRLEIIVDGQQLKQTTAFRYLGSWQHESGDLDREITQDCRVHAGNTWRNVSGIIHDKRMPIRLKTQV
jgi:hypothetical protein